MRACYVSRVSRQLTAESDSADEAFALELEESSHSFQYLLVSLAVNFALVARRKPPSLEVIITDSALIINSLAAIVGFSNILGLYCCTGNQLRALGAGGLAVLTTNSTWRRQKRQRSTAVIELHLMTHVMHVASIDICGA